MATVNVAPTPPTDQLQVVGGAPSPERIYVATPKTLYGTGRLHRAVRALRARFPDAFLLLPAQLFQSRDDWLARFPRVLETLTRLVFLTDVDGFIGRGVASECCAALQAGKPVDFLTDTGELIPHGRLRLSAPNESDWVKYRHVTVRPTER